MTEQGTRTPINLEIGGIIVVKEASLISTVLGSCVSVCLKDELNGIAGMNHYMLPEPTRPDDKNIGRYGILSIPELLNQLKKSGASMPRLKAKVFGGGQLLSALTKFKNISQRNIDIALEILKNNGIPVVAQDVGGNRGRKIQFYTDTGRVMVRQVGEKNRL